MAMVGWMWYQLKCWRIFRFDVYTPTHTIGLSCTVQPQCTLQQMTDMRHIDTADGIGRRPCNSCVSLKMKRRKYHWKGMVTHSRWTIWTITWHGFELTRHPKWMFESVEHATGLHLSASADRPSDHQTQWTRWLTVGRSYHLHLGWSSDQEDESGAEDDKDQCCQVPALPSVRPETPANHNVRLQCGLNAWKASSRKQVEAVLQLVLRYI